MLLWLSPEKSGSQAEEQEEFEMGAAEESEQVGNWRLGQSTKGHWCVWHIVEAQLCVSAQAGIWRYESG